MKNPHTDVQELNIPRESYKAAKVIELSSSQLVILTYSLDRSTQPIKLVSLKSNVDGTDW